MPTHRPSFHAPRRDGPIVQESWCTFGGGKTHQSRIFLGNSSPLSGLADAIGQTMPDNFTLLAFRPDTILKPCPVTGTRVALTEMEKSALGLDPEIWRNLKIHMIHDHKTLERRLDFYPRDSSFHKLAMSADEGTEAGMDGKT